MTVPVTGPARGPAVRPGVRVSSVLLVVVALIALAACGLPLDAGVREPGPVTGEQRRAGELRVLPPGPRDAMEPQAVVQGFLDAQSSPDGAHAIAREFLAPGSTWDDRAGVQVYDPAPSTLRVEAVAGPQRTFRVTAPLVGLIDKSGAYRPATPGTKLKERYVLRQEGRRWRLVSVPTGLQLSVADRDRSLRARQVYFLAAPAPGRPVGRLVADRLFLPVDVDQAPLLVDRLLAGPSAALRNGVHTAVPPRTRLLSAKTGPPGTITVDLSGEIDRLGAGEREQLSAQLVWTLRSLGTDFTRLRLLSQGRPFDVAGVGPQQDADYWKGYDPDGESPVGEFSDGGAYYLAERQVRRLDSASRRPATPGPPVFPDRADLAALAPPPVLAAGLAAGLLARRPDGRWDALTGELGGKFTRRATRDALASPSFGDGGDGLWVLQTRPGYAVLLIPALGDPMPVPVQGMADWKTVTALRVSRDGARMALVADGRLHVGVIERSPGRVRVTGLRVVSPGLVGVRDVTWETGTALVVLAQSGVGNRAVLPYRVAVDGSTVTVIGRPGLPAAPVSVTAAPGSPLVIGATVGKRAELFRDNGRLFDQLQVSGAAPFYPG